MLKSSQSHAAKLLVVRRRHAAAFATFARILNVPPQLFLDWQLNDLVEQFEEPAGSMCAWVNDDLIERSEEEKEGVRLRYAAWLKAKGVEPSYIKALLNPRRGADAIPDNVIAFPVQAGAEKTGGAS